MSITTRFNHELNNVALACKEDLHNFGDKKIFPNNPKHVFC
jgi:hypothetical protein